MKSICYRIGTAPCATGWVNTVNCTDPNIYSLAIGGVPVVGAIEVACGDCPEVVTLAGGAGGGYTDPTPDLTDAELRAAPVVVTTAAVIRAADLTTSTTTGTVAAGATSVGFSNEGAVAATVAGGQLLAGRTVSFDTNGADTLAAIPYTATGTTLVIATVR